jgi:single-stranded DNA-binding protein
MDKSERIAAKGTVTNEPKVNSTDKGKLYTRITIAADTVSIDGRPVKAEDHKWQTAVFWGVDAVDRVNEVRQGAVVSIEGDHKVRQVEGREDGKMREFSEIHHGALQIEKQPRERVAGVPVELKGEVLYDPELKGMAGRPGQFYTVVTVRPENTEDKVRAPFFGDEAVAIARSVRKGAEVSLKGELVQREYTNAKGVQTTGMELQKAEVRLPQKDRTGERGTRREAEAELGR